VIEMSILSELEIKKAREMLEDMEDRVTLIVAMDGNQSNNKNNDQNNNQSKEFEEFARNISDLSDKIEVVFGQRELPYPGIILKKGEQENIVYHAIPTKHEFEPFIKTIVGLSRGEANLSEKNLDKIKGIESELITFVAQLCPHCAKVVEKVNAMAIANPKIESRIVDAILFSDIAQKYEIMSTPTVLINGKIKLVGALQEDELVEWLIKSSTDYKLDYFVKLLGDGRIEEVEAMVASHEDIEVLVEILKRSEVMARIGAVLLLERLFKKNPELVKSAKQKIREMLHNSDSNVKQDVAMVLGKIGDSSDIPFLERLLEDEDEEVKEAASEAIEEIKARCA
jgi:thiol-disulfide isomerase/thioredoxin